MKYDITHLTQEMKKKLKPKRYVHSVGVMYTAQALAMRYNVDIKVAGTAGILHDCAKEMNEEELFEFCNTIGISISEDENLSRFLLHSKAGAYLAKHRYEIYDDSIISAIRYHTTGHPEMTMLEKIIFSADYIEPNRKPINELDVIRKECFTDIDKASGHILKNTIEYLQEEKRHVDANSLEAYEYYKRYFE